MTFGAIALQIEAIAKELVDAMLIVHRELGPGLLESTYQACLAYELRSRGPIGISRQLECAAD
jgi:GxxExxY protein